MKRGAMNLFVRIIVFSFLGMIVVACSESKPDEIATRIIFESNMKSLLGNIHARKIHENERYDKWLKSLDKSRLSDNLAREVRELEQNENKTKLLSDNIPFVIVTFEKINGQMKMLSGVETYVVEYSATVEYPEGVVSECLGKENSGVSESLSCEDILHGSHPLPKGARVVSLGEISFEMTDKGWRGEDGKIY